MWQMPPPVNLVRGTTGGDDGVKSCSSLRVELLVQGGNKPWKSLRMACTSSYIGRLCDTRLRTMMVVGPAGHAAAARCIQYCTNIICLCVGGLVT